MFKQPAENTNATGTEARDAADRTKPVSRAVDQEEVAEVARQLWRERGGVGGSPEADWYRAEQIVRDRRVATLGAIGASGNASDQEESYLAGTEHSRISAETQSKEPSIMDNSMTGMMEQTGTGSGIKERVSDLTNRANEQVSELANRANEMMVNEPQSFPRPEHREGRIARSIEQQTAKLPSDVWLWAAVGSIGLSLALELSGREKTANFVGHWAPTFLILGLYNKMVKLQGSDGL